MTAPLRPCETEGFPTLDSCLRRGADARFTDEYAVKLRRLLPWRETVETHRPMTGFGVIWVVIEPGRQVEAHDHDEEECFVIVAGSADITMLGDTATLTKGDVIYIPRFAPHALRNTSPSEDFVMIDIYWDDRSVPRA